MTIFCLKMSRGQAIGHTWFLKGVKLIGTLHYETGEILCVEKETYDTDAFLLFLETVLTVGRIVMVLDNARIHHTKIIQPFLEANRDRLELVFLPPPYSPQFNLMECKWKWLKETVIYNVFFDSVQKIMLAVRLFLQYSNEHPKEAIDLSVCQNVK